MPSSIRRPISPGPGGRVHHRADAPDRQAPELVREPQSIPGQYDVPGSDFANAGEGPSASRSVAPPAGLDLPAKPPRSQSERQERARATSERVVTKAKEVVTKAEGIYKSIGGIDFTALDFQKTDMAASLREFERDFAQFHAFVRQVLDEYVGGDTLVMDLILKYQLDKPTVQHALKVAAFATEMTSLLALRDTDSGEYMESYFGDMSDSELLADLGRPVAAEKLDDTRCGSIATSCSATTW